jgi:hypothetical protein
MTDFDEIDDDLDGLDDGADETPVIRKLRQQLRATKKTVRELTPLADRARQYDRDSTVKDAGLDFLTPTQRSAVLAISGDDLSIDKLRATAASLGWQPAVDPAVTQALDGEQRIAQATAGGGSVTPPAPPNLQQQIAEAEKAGDHKLSMALKSQWGADLMTANLR